MTTERERRAFWLIIVGFLVAGVVLVGYGFYRVPPVGAAPPDWSYPVAHDNTVTESDNCTLIDGHIHVCTLENGPQWVNLDQSNPGRYLATGTYTLDTTTALPWLRVRDMERRATILVAPAGSSFVLLDNGDAVLGYSLDNATMTRRQYKTTALTLTGGHPE